MPCGDHFVATDVFCRYPLTVATRGVETHQIGGATCRVAQASSPVRLAGSDCSSEQERGRSVVDTAGVPLVKRRPKDRKTADPRPGRATVHRAWLSFGEAGGDRRGVRSHRARAVSPLRQQAGPAGRRHPHRPGAVPERASAGPGRGNVDASAAERRATRPHHRGRGIALADGAVATRGAIPRRGRANRGAPAHQRDRGGHAPGRTAGDCRTWILSTRSCGHGRCRAPSPAWADTT